MTRTQVIVEKNKRRAEIRSKVRCAAVISLCIVIGAIPFGLKIHEVLTEEQTIEEAHDDTYIRLFYATGKGPDRKVL